VLNRKAWTSSILYTSSLKGSARRISSTRGFLGYFINVIRLPHQLHHHFIVDMVRHKGASPTTSSSTCVRLEGLHRLHRRRRLSPSSSTSTSPTSIGFRLEGLRRLLRRRWLSASSSTSTSLTSTGLQLEGLHRLLRRHRLSASSALSSPSTSSTSTFYFVFIVYFIDVDPGFTLSTRTLSHAVYNIKAFVTITRQEGLWWHRDEWRHPEAWSLARWLWAKGKRWLIIIDYVLKEEQERKEKCMEAPKARPKQMEEKHWG
jgi:hypothetical protein